MSEEEFELIRGSGNIFRDLGDPDADIKQAKAILAARIIAVIDDKGLSVRKAASLTGFAAADFSRVRNADLGRFTLDRLIKMLGALDDSIEVTIHVALRPSSPALSKPRRRNGMGKSRKTFDVGRDSKSGQFITVRQAVNRPNTTTVERVPKRGYGDTKDEPTHKKIKFLQSI